jgi:hypothetical protein
MFYLKDGKRRDHVKRWKVADRLHKLYRGRRDVRLEGEPGEPPRCVQCYSDSGISVSDISELHLQQTLCLGVYLVRDGDVCFFAVVDFDDKPENPDPDVRLKVAAVCAELDRAGIDYLVSSSQGGRGFHVAIFFVEAVPARLVRWFLRGICSSVGFPQLEVFPKQDELKAGQVGNAVRLPLFNRSRFVDPHDDFAEVDALTVLKSVRRHTRADITAAAETLDIDLTPKKHIVRVGENASTDALPAYVQELLADEKSKLSRRWRGDTTGLKDPSRSALVMAITCLLIRRYVPTEDIIDTLRHWCRENHYVKGDRDDWIELTISKAYQLVQSSKLDLSSNEAINAMVGNYPPAIAHQIRNSLQSKGKKK